MPLLTRSVQSSQTLCQTVRGEMPVLKPGNACASSLQLYCVSGRHISTLAGQW